MNAALPKRKSGYTWDDYQSWPDDERWEIIDGHPYAMSPSPASRHQLIISALAAALFDQLRGKSCRTFVAPMDVRLSDEDVVQPDLLIVCDEKQIKRTHIEGAPKIVVEVLSPASEQHDRRTKRECYARFGVPEYWIVTPFPHLVEVFTLRDGFYTAWKTFDHRDRLISAALPGLEIDLGPVFDFPLGDDEKALFFVKEPPSRYRTPATGGSTDPVQRAG